MFEHHAKVMADGVARMVTTAEPRPAPARWMTTRRRQVIEAIIETELDQGLTVRRLAAAIGLSEGFFTRVFKAATGKAPHD